MLKLDMDKLNIYFSKVFCRMRHKTQLFNGAADDHYHTRLQHTIEVEEIALRMAKRIMADNPSLKCDLLKVSSIALLHDIGHTPFGHAGERALHEIVSGKCYKELDLPDFINMGVAIGFKHNLNSGFLYIENFIFEVANFDILNGIVKHTKLYYKDEKNLDYGFGYIFHPYKKCLNNNKSNSLEGLIVAYADEIAQICSDFLDINLNAKSNNKRAMFDCKPYNMIDTVSSEKRIEAKDACDKMIDLFIESFKKNNSLGEFKNNDFTDVIKEFDCRRQEVIEKNKEINSFDKRSKNIIKTLYAYYFKNPYDLNQDFYDDFVYRIDRICFSCSGTYYLYIEPLSSRKDEVIDFLNFVANSITDNQNNLSNRMTKDFKLIYKMYIRSLAIYISKMTDNYAKHKYYKIMRKHNKDNIVNIKHKKI